MMFIRRSILRSLMSSLMTLVMGSIRRAWVSRPTISGSEVYKALLHAAACICSNLRIGQEQSSTYGYVSSHAVIAAAHDTTAGLCFCHSSKMYGIYAKQ